MKNTHIKPETEILRQKAGEPLKKNSVSAAQDAIEL
jgi:hypothetical protein